MKNKTILFVFHNADIYSGATRSLVDLIEQLLLISELKILAIFPSTKGSAIEYLAAKKIKIFSAYYDGLMQDECAPFWKRCLKMPLYFYRLLRIKNSSKTFAQKIKQENIDLIYTNTSVILFGAYLAQILQVPHIWHFREFRKEDHQIHYFLGENVHMRYAATHADRYIMISESMRKKHTKWFDPKKMRVIYNNLSAHYIFRSKKYNTEQNIQILIAGDVKPGKGQLETVIALSILKERNISAVLHIAGNCKESPYVSELKQLIRDRKLDNFVVFHGLVKDMNELRKQMDIGIVASKLEAFGRVTIEGMLAKIAMVGCNSGGTAELISNGKTGYLYESGDYNELARIIEELVSNRSKMIQVSEKGFTFAKEHFTSGKCARSILKEIESLVE